MDACRLHAEQDQHAGNGRAGQKLDGPLESDRELPIRTSNQECGWDCIHGRDAQKSEQGCPGRLSTHSRDVGADGVCEKAGRQVEDGGPCQPDIAKRESIDRQSEVSGIHETDGKDKGRGEPGFEAEGTGDGEGQ